MSSRVTADTSVTPPGLGARVRLASAITLSGSFGSQGLRLVGNLILTRLLVPEAFGVMALVNVTVYGLQMMSDLGIRASIVQSQRDDEAFVHTLWSVQVGRGFVLWAVASALAFPLAAFYAAPDLRSLLPVVALTAVIDGFASTRLFTLNRKLVLGRLTAIELGAQATGIGLMIGYALWSPSVWALVAGTLVGSTSKTLLSHLAIPGATDRFAWDPTAARELLGFGRWILLSSATNFLSSRGDVLLLGALMSLPALGIYSLAIVMTNAASSIIGALRSRVVLPALSQIVREEPSRLSPIYYRARRALEFLGLSIAMVLVAGGDSIVNVLYDPRYSDAGWMVRILALRLVLAAVGGPGAMCLVALGKPQYMFWANLSQALWLACCVPLAMYLGGLHATIWAIASYDLPASLIISAGLVRWRVFSLRQELRFVLLAALGMVVALIVRPWLGSLFG
ncbi:MAG: oligosaccharide flippase family protein [bacterium]|nr:oligosaccharide flippase family protein [bacterium]